MQSCHCFACAQWHTIERAVQTGAAVAPGASNLECPSKAAFAPGLITPCRPLLLAQLRCRTTAEDQGAHGGWAGTEWVDWLHLQHRTLHAHHLCLRLPCLSPPTPVPDWPGPCRCAARRPARPRLCLSWALRRCRSRWSGGRCCSACATRPSTPQTCEEWGWGTGGLGALGLAPEAYVFGATLACWGWDATTGLVGQPRPPVPGWAG